MTGRQKYTQPLIIFSLLGFSVAAWAEVSRYEEPIRYRQAVMTMVKRHYAQITAMAKGTIPLNQAELNRHANTLEMLSRVSLDGFVAGSHDGETKAKPEIWKDFARFRALTEKFQADAVRLRDVAKTGNPETLKVALAEMTRTCKNCHDDFKATSVER